MHSLSSASAACGRPARGEEVSAFAQQRVRKRAEDLLGVSQRVHSSQCLPSTQCLLSPSSASANKHKTCTGVSQCVTLASVCPRPGEFTWKRVHKHAEYLHWASQVHSPGSAYASVRRSRPCTGRSGTRTLPATRPQLCGSIKQECTVVCNVGQHNAIIR